MVDNVTSNYMIKYIDHEFETFDPNIKICKKRRKQREGRGQMMDIKLPTVKTHVSHILTKLGGGKPQKRGENRGKEA